MPDDETPGSGNRWVRIDVAAEALGVTERQAARIAKQDGWRTAPRSRPRQYLFADITTTYKNRKASAK